MSYKIKKDRKTGNLTITNGKRYILSLPPQSFAEVATAMVEFVLRDGSGWRVISEKQDGKMKGVYWYHFSKSLFLAWVYDVKKSFRRKYGKKTEDTK